MLGRAFALATATASAAPFAPYDGSNPFRCKIQNVGTGVDFPDPGADPFCVEFDKTNENVTDFGIVDFLLNEPARVAAAVPSASTTRPTTGRDRSCRAPSRPSGTGTAATSSTRRAGWAASASTTSSSAGLPMDPRLLPGLPGRVLALLRAGDGGGAFLNQTVPADPSCAARVDTPQEVKKIYRDGWRYPRLGTLRRL